MGYVLHQNKWNWGRYEIIVIFDGFALCKVSVENDDPSIAWLSDVVVFEAMRHLGLGNRLSDIAMVRAMKMGAKKLGLWTDPKGWPLEWYKRRGFEYQYTDLNGQAVLEMDLEKHFNGR